MPKISYSVPNLLGGISQQDPVMRLPNQVEDCLNFSIDAAQGVRTRPPTTFEDELSLSSTSMNTKFHFIRRDENEKYVIGVTNTGALYAYDLVNKTPVTITDNTPGSTAAAYLTTGGDPVKNIRMSTIADSTFIVNRAVTVGMLESSRTAAPTNQGLFQITRGLWNLSYVVSATHENGTTNSWTFTTGTPTSALDSTTYDTGQIASSLAALIDAHADYTASVLGDGDTVLVSSSLASPIASLSVKDNFGGTASRSAYRIVTGRNDLPRFGAAGIVLKVLEDGGDREYSYYVNWSPKVENPSAETEYSGNGYWKECVGWESLTKFDPTTMPLEMKRVSVLGVTSFSIELGGWNDRITGDDDSCPQPSFVGKTISDIFFHQNRIGFLAGENVVMSRAADLKNFWNESARSLYDTDPIDIAASTRDVNNLKSAVPIQGALLIDGENKQFTMQGSAGFSPKTTSMTVTTSHVCQDVIPAVVGSYAYLPVKRGDYSTLREYRIDSLTATAVAPDVTQQVDRLIDGEVVGMVASSAYNSLYVHARTDDGLSPYIYVYQWLEQNNQKIQSSWVRWMIGADIRIYGMAAFDKDIWIVCKRSGDDAETFALLRMDTSLPPVGSIPFVPSMDCIADISSIAYSAVTGLTTFSIVDHKKEGARPYILFKQDFAPQGLKAGDNLTGITWNSGFTSGTIKGDYTGAELVYGYMLPCSLVFSTQYMREGQGGSGAILDGRLQLLEGRVAYNESGEFNVVVDTTKRGGGLYKYPKSGMLGDVEFTYGNPYISTGIHRFAILSPNTGVVISLVVDKFYPVTIQKFEWSGMFTLNAQRV